MDTSELQKVKQRYNIVGNSDGLNRALDVALQVADRKSVGRERVC